MGWFGGNGCGGCAGAGTPCFCTGSFTDFQVTFSGVAYNSWTYGGSSTLCAPIGGANHINGTHTVAAGSQTGFYCTAKKTLDGGPLGDATKPVQRVNVDYMLNGLNTSSCDCHTPTEDLCEGGYDYCYTRKCQALIYLNETYFVASINFDDPNLVLKVMLIWPEYTRYTFPGTTYLYTIYPWESWGVHAAYAYWEKTIAVKSCTSINEMLTFTNYDQGVCTLTPSVNGGTCISFDTGKDGTYDFSSATCSLALV